MKELGEWLKKTREEQNIKLSDIEQETKIRMRYLEAIEAGNMDILPEPVYTMGFLRSYAHAIGVDEEQVAQYYREWQDEQKHLQGKQEPFATETAKASPPRKREQQAPTASQEAPPLRQPGYSYNETRDRRFGKGIGAIVAILVVVAVVLVFYFVGKQQSESGSVPPVDPPPVTSQEPPTNLPEDEDTPDSQDGEGETLPETSTPTTYEGVHLVITAGEDSCWVGITADGVYSEDEIDAGTSKIITADETIKVRYGNAGVVTVELNGQIQPVPGEKGQVVTVEYQVPVPEADADTAIPQ